MGRGKGGFAGLNNRIFTVLGLGFAANTSLITGDRSMRPMNTRAALTAPLALAGIGTLPLALAACGYQPSLGDYRPVVDSYNTGHGRL